MSAPDHPEHTGTHEVLVVGSGFAELGQLLALRRAGVTDVVLLEADALGGPGRDSPGRARDVPSPVSSRADEHDLRRHVHAGQEMTGATWDEQDGAWAVHTRGGATWRARFLVLGTGALHRPDVPAPGAETFGGPAFHAAQRDHDVDLRGRRVAVIGAGAGAIRFFARLVSDDHHPTLARPDVEVITSGVREVRPGAIVDGDGTEREADVIVYGTGFHVTDALDRLEITGRGGRTLRQVWAEHGRATHLGMTVSDFPNLFLLPGPDTDLGHGPGVAVIERRARYVAQAITTVHASGMGGLDVRAEVQQRSNAAGVDRTIWPGSTLRYWWRTRRFEPADFELFGRAADAAATPTPEEAAGEREGEQEPAPVG